MTEDELNLQISDAAAMLFWSSVADFGFDRTVAEVTSTNGRWLMGHPRAREILGAYRFSELSDDQMIRAFDSIGDFASDLTRREENLQGVIYAEDAATGRSPAAVEIDVSGLCANPPLVRGNEGIEQIGELCLRYPLPAVLFADKRPRSNFIQVASTARALGVEYPMFLMRTGETEMPGGLVAITGIFQIPVPDEETGDEWAGVIQNATRITGAIGVRMPGGRLCQIDFGWRAR
jgi:hypothetical protein